MFVLPHCHLSKSAVLALSVFAALAAVPAARGQNTYDAQIPFSFSSPTLMSPRGVAVAPDGTVYIADPRTGVVEISPTTGTVTGPAAGAASIAATATLLAPSIGLTAPTAVAVDSTGALYIGDSTAGEVIEMATPKTSSAATAITYPGTETPTALAVDSNNNLYIADETQNAIYEVAKGVAAQLPISPAGLKPVGLAVDSSGNVYFASALKNEVYRYTASTKLTAVDTVAGTFEFSASNAVLPIGMGFDPAGDLYVMDSGSGKLIEITSTTNYRLPISSSVTPASLAASSIGNLYISDDAADTADEVFYNNNPFNFGPVMAATDSPAVTVNFYFTTKEPQIAIYQSMQGDITTEFNTSSPNCTGDKDSLCSMAFYVAYSSALPGTRIGEVGLTDVHGDILAVPNIGIDLAGALALYPGNQVELPTTETLYEPQGLAVTGNDGTLFIADEGEYLPKQTPDYKHGAVWEYTITAGAPAGTPTKVGTFATPDAVALDAEGNLYVADYSGTVTEMPVSYSSTKGNRWTGSGTALSLTGAAALTHPMSLTFDPSGNLYIGDMGPAGVNATASDAGYIVEVPANGGPAVRLNYTVGGVPIVFPQALAADSQGNLYIADAGDGDTDQGGVDVVSVATGTASAISFGAFAPLSQPSGLSFDAANDLYVLDGYNQRVLVVPITFAGTVPTADTGGITLLGQGVSGITSAIVTPSNLVVWPGGQYITISDLGFTPTTGTANPVQVLTLQSVNASVGASSGSASVTGVNVGSDEITFAPPGSMENPDFVLSGCGSSSGSTLATGITADCTTTITYTPSGNASLTDIFTLNGNTAMDGSALGNQIAVSGVSEEPVGVWSGGGQQTSQFGATVTLTNTGILPLNIAAVGSTNGSVGGVTDLTGTCTLLPSLNQNQSCTVTFTFTAENDNATIFVTDNSGGTEVVQSVIVTFGTDPYESPAISIPRSLLNRDTLNRSNDPNALSDSTKGKGGKKLHQ